MAKKKAQSSVSTRFPVGQRGGCEAMLYEFRQRASASVVEASDRQPTDPAKYTRRIAATRFEEAFAYLRWADPDFVIDSAICLGLIRMVSGTPVD